MAKLLAHLPECLTIKGTRYYRYLGGMTDAEVIRTCKLNGAKYRKVEVLQQRLRGVQDLHGKDYKPRPHIYTTLPQTN